MKKVTKKKSVSKAKTAPAKKSAPRKLKIAAKPAPEKYAPVSVEVYTDEKAKTAVVKIWTAFDGFVPAKQLSK